MGNDRALGETVVQEVAMLFHELLFVRRHRGQKIRARRDEFAQVVLHG
jgi:hypothetical protein